MYTRRGQSGRSSDIRRRSTCITATIDMSSNPAGMKGQNGFSRFRVHDRTAAHRLHEDRRGLIGLAPIASLPDGGGYCDEGDQCRDRADDAGHENAGGQTGRRSTVLPLASQPGDDDAIFLPGSADSLRPGHQQNRLSVRRSNRPRCVRVRLPDSLFAIPAGYKLVDPTTRPASAARRAHHTCKEETRLCLSVNTVRAPFSTSLLLSATSCVPRRDSGPRGPEGGQRPDNDR